MSFRGVPKADGESHCFGQALFHDSNETLLLPRKDRGDRLRRLPKDGTLADLEEVAQVLGQEDRLVQNDLP